jgi:hypothetical protein
MGLRGMCSVRLRSYTEVVDCQLIVVRRGWWLVVRMCSLLAGLLWQRSAACWGFGRLLVVACKACSSFPRNWLRVHCHGYVVAHLSWVVARGWLLEGCAWSVGGGWELGAGGSLQVERWKPLASVYIFFTLSKVTCNGSVDVTTQAAG